MARKRRRAVKRRFPFASAVLLALGVAVVWAALQAERKLSALALGGLGESFSTRVWSAPFMLRTGARAATDRLLERLDRLSYRRVERVPSRGEYRWSPPELDVNLRGFRAPTGSQTEGYYSLRREGDGTWTVNDRSGADAGAILLEPELAAQLSGARKLQRDPLDWAQIPKSLVDAVVAAEDKRFWTHWGLDPRAMTRAAWANARGRELQGASTITQQLSKNLYLSPRRTFSRKLAEAGLALYLERRLDKRRILTLYLNHIYLGQDGSASVMGMRAAARFYFAKDPAELTLAESATLAGLIRGPGLYDPRRDPEACRARRDHVLRRMHEEGFITASAMAAALAEPLSPASRQNEDDARDDAYYAAEVVRQLLPRYGGDVLYRNGLSIYTAMDPVLQSVAQRALRGGKHQAALVALDARTGDVLALAGGRDFSESQFNRATQALRQPGSAFKPFVYTAALKMGLTAATVLLDRRRRFPGADGGWSPANYDGVYFGSATVRKALAHSLNAATLDLAERVGIDRIQESARAAGITSPLRHDLGLALGASEVGLLELVSAYEPFADGGYRATPRLVLAVAAADGSILETTPPESVAVMDPAVAYMMTSLMRSVVTEGTARALPALGFSAPAAGKTGTTNDGRDAWFIGYTSSLLAGVWVGDDRNRALKLTGAKDALPLWAEFMKEASADRAAEEFVRPAGVVQVRICPESGMLALSGCPNKIDEIFVAGTEPLHDCVLHRGGLMGWIDRLTRPR